MRRNPHRRDCHATLATGRRLLQSRVAAKRSQSRPRCRLPRARSQSRRMCPRWQTRRAKAPHDDVRIGCLNVWGGVRTSLHQPINRGHHDHRPSGTSPARRTGPGTYEMRSGRLRLAPVERRAVDPDAVENHGDLPCNGDLRFLHADSLRELHSPGLKRGPFLRPIKQNGRRFE